MTHEDMKAIARTADRFSAALENYSRAVGRHDETASKRANRNVTIFAERLLQEIVENRLYRGLR